ncbi:MAG: ferredoxin family protein, partial [Planctomycetota bacterium]
KIDLSKLFGAPDPGAPGADKAVDVAVRERDEQLLLAGRDLVGNAVGVPKRQAAAGNKPKDELDTLLDQLDAIDL